MKLLEALEILRQPPPAGDSSAIFRVFLATGFTPLDLQTFLAAHLRQRLAGRPVEVATGLYGDLAGSLERLDSSAFERVFVALEWPDLDPGLGWRSAGSWNPEDLPGMVRNVETALDRLAAILEPMNLAVVSLPTLAPSPVFTDSPESAGKMYWALMSALSGFAERVSGGRAIVVHPDALAARSPVSERFDIRSDLAAGFPYKRTHADALACSFCAAALPDTPRKGLIVDLDDTLWLGLVGEDGVQGIAWDLDHKAQIHGLFQKIVAGLAASGVLTAVASKNDPDLVRQALARKDILIPPDTFFPIEVHWQPKSESVRRILEAWNIAADSVIFIDDNEMELAEVAQAHPGIETLRFPKEDPAAAADLFALLRRRFGRRTISAEDRLRAESLKSAGMPRDGRNAGEDFLAGAEAVITFDPANPPEDDRPLELVNKTNQFNLNGVRYSPGEWSTHLRTPGAFLLTVSYRDRFGALGRIAVLSGIERSGDVELHIWVMSCRAFSRRIEHKCLEYIFETLGARSILLDFRETERNGPLREFLSSLTGLTPEALLRVTPEAPLRLTKEQFVAACPALHHRAEILSHV